MRRTLRALVCVSAMAMGSACAPQAPAAPQGPSPADMVAAANALDQQFSEAFNKADVDAVMATYWKSPDLVSIGPEGMGAKGWDAVKADTSGMFQGMPGAKLEFTSAHNEAQGDVVLGWGTWKITIPAQPMPQVLEGRYSDVKALRDGKWVYVMDHASAPLPPPPAAAPVTVKK
jgi:ketosteroid isomerase-like protein